MGSKPRSVAQPLLRPTCSIAIPSSDNQSPLPHEQAGWRYGKSQQQHSESVG